MAQFEKNYDGKDRNLRMYFFFLVRSEPRWPNQRGRNEGCSFLFDKYKSFQIASADGDSCLINQGLSGRLASKEPDR